MGLETSKNALQLNCLLISLMSILRRREGAIGLKTRWRDYSKALEEEPEFKAVEANSSGSKARELFELFMEDLVRDCDKAKVGRREKGEGGGVQASRPGSCLSCFLFRGGGREGR